MAKKSGASADPTHRSIATNRKARHDYEILETFDAGMELLGSEVKSLRAGHVTFTDAHVGFDKDEAYLLQLHIPEYSFANQFNHDPTRKRKLLLKKKEILELQVRVRENSMSIVPLELYFKGSWVKVTIAIGKGRKLHDKREALKEKDAKRDMRRAID